MATSSLENSRTTIIMKLKLLPAKYYQLAWKSGLTMCGVEGNGMPKLDGDVHNLKTFYNIPLINKLF